MGSVAKRIPIGIQRRGELISEGGRHSRDEVEGHRAQLAGFGARNSHRACADGPGELASADPSADPCPHELVREPRPKLPTPPFADRRPGLSHRHDHTVSRGASLRLTSGVSLVSHAPPERRSSRRPKGPRAASAVHRLARGSGSGRTRPAVARTRHHRGCRPSHDSLASHALKRTGRERILPSAPSMGTARALELERSRDAHGPAD